MKPILDKEIDSLLRRSPALWPQGASSPAAAREPLHLDADELNAYAENGLPDAARARFASHLADCDECRKIIVELTMAADVAGDLEKRAAVAPLESIAHVPAWRAWLSALFAPRVLRYAVPLVAFCIVGAITFIALRTREGERQSALSTSSIENRNNYSTPEEIATGTTSSNAPLAGTQGQATSNSSISQAEKPTPVSSATNANASAPLTIDGASESTKDAPPPPSSPLPVNGRIAGSETALDKPQLKTGAAPPAATAGASMPSDDLARVEIQKSAKPDEESKRGSRDDVASNVESARQVDDLAQLRSRQNAQQQSPDGSRSAAQRAALNNAAGGGGSASSSGASAPASREEARSARRGHSAEPESADKKEKSPAKEVNDTRGVAGHRFQMRDGVWTDVNYKSSMAMTGVRRGTEGYRALIADLPELGRIADQLGGELVVVIKGRAYRIR